MQWQVILALVVTIPVILIPVVLVWYLTIGGIYAAIKEARERRTVHEKEAGELARTEQRVAVETVKKHGN